MGRRFRRRQVRTAAVWTQSDRTRLRVILSGSSPALYHDGAGGGQEYLIRWRETRPVSPPQVAVPPRARSRNPMMRKPRTACETCCSRSRALIRPLFPGQFRIAQRRVDTQGFARSRCGRNQARCAGHPRDAVGAGMIRGVKHPQPLLPRGEGSWARTGQVLAGICHSGWGCTIVLGHDMAHEINPFPTTRLPSAYVSIPLSPSPDRRRFRSNSVAARVSPFSPFCVLVCWVCPKPKL